jgi:hypothetical protein
MTMPIRPGSSWDPRASYDVDEPNLCPNPHDSVSASDAPTAVELPAANQDESAERQARERSSNSCSIACGAATSLACAGVGFGVGLALSPTVVGAAAGAAVGLDCSLLSVVACGQICKN